MNEGIYPPHLRVYVVRPVLERLERWSPAAEELLLGTAAQETHMGRWLHQLKGGPALGIYQMEPRTHEDLWERYLASRAELASEVRGFASQHLCQQGHGSLAEQLVGNLYYATAMARIYYWRVPRALPEPEDVEALARYWKEHWNTYLGAGTVEEFITNYRRFVA